MSMVPGLLALACAGASGRSPDVDYGTTNATTTDEPLGVAAMQPPREF